MTWARFLALRAWAREVADKHDAHVYLVGSVLSKEVPRDIDVAIVKPLAWIEETFGPMPGECLPRPNGGHDGNLARMQWLNRLRAHIYEDFENAQVAVNGVTHIDVKLTPDSWWPEKDRLLLAEPKRS